MNNSPLPPTLNITVGPYKFASPDMVGRRMSNGKFWSVGIVLQHNLDVILSLHNNHHARRKKTVSYATMAKRAYEIKQAGWLLVRKGINEDNSLTRNAMRLMIPTNIRKSHILKLTRTWEEDPRWSVGTVIQKKSILNVLMNWMGKGHLMAQIKPEEFFLSPELITRSLASNKDKSWGNANIDEMIESVEKENKYLARQLRLSQHFGLRARESMMFRPRQDYDKTENLIHIRHGAKNGHIRTIEIRTEIQQIVLNDAIENCTSNRQSMMPKGANLKAWRSHYYYILKKNGICRNNGIVPHGLRHSFAQDLYKKATGTESKVVTGIKPSISLLQDQAARLFISNQLGHHRPSISSAYIGDSKE